MRELLDYDPVTGLFRWKQRHGKKNAAGDLARKLNNKRYIDIWIDGVRHQAHQLAWFYVYGEWPPGDLDHRDTVRHHNWIANLRPATNSQNQANVGLRRDNTSGMKGVHFHRRDQKWEVRIRKDGARLYVGTFDSAAEAQAAYAAKQRELFGEFARSE